MCHSAGGGARRLTARRANLFKKYCCCRSLLQAVGLIRSCRVTDSSCLGRVLTSEAPPFRIRAVDFSSPYHIRDPHLTPNFQCSQVDLRRWLSRMSSSPRQEIAMAFYPCSLNPHHGK